MKKSLLYPKTIAISVMTAILFLFSTATSFAATYFSIASGNWSNATGTVWSLSSGGAAVAANVFPGLADDVVIERGFTVTMDITTSCNSLQLAGTATNNGGTLTFAAGSLTLTVTNAVLNGNSGNAARDGFITFASGSTLVAGSLTMGGTAATPGQGTITMTAGGLLRINGTITLGATPGTWTPGTGTVELTATNTLPATPFTTFNNLTITGGTTTLGAAATLVVNNLLNLAGGSVVMPSGGNDLTVGGLTGSGNITGGTAARTVTVNGALTPAVYSGVISDGTAAVSLVKSGAGTLILSGASTYTGTTTITAGTISINTLLNVSGGASALGAPTSVANGTIAMGGVTSVLRYTGAATSSNRVINTTSDGPTIDASGSGTLTLTGALTGNDDITLTGTGIGIENGAIGTAGGGTFTKTGTGTWTLGGLNTFNGVTTINAGVLSVGTIAAGGTSSNLGAANAITLTGGTLRYTGATASTNRTVALTGNANVIDVTTLATSLTITGIASGALGGYTKAGVGTLVMSGVNTYTGVTTIGGGVLSVGTIGNGGVAGNLGQAAVAAANLVIDTGTLRYTGVSAGTNRGFTLTGTLAPYTTVDIFTGGVILTVSGTVTGGSTRFIKAGAGTLTRSTTPSTFAGDFVLAAGTFTTDQNTSLAGNWVNNGGTFTQTGATAVTFNGTSAQTIGGTAATTFNGLTVNNAAGVSLTTVDATANAAVTLTIGNLTIPFSRTLTIANGTAFGGSPFSAANSIVTQVDPSSTAKGFVRVNLIPNAAVYTIPASNGGNYLPVILTPTEIAANNSYSVCVFPGVTADGEANGTPFTASQKNTCVDAVWTVNYNAAGTPSTTMRVEWPTSLEGTKFSTFTLPAEIAIARYNAGWGIPVGTGAHGTPNQATRPAVTAFSPFGVGNPAYQALSIKITYFNAAKGNGYNTVNWQAACSSPQATFEVLRSTDGRNFTSISSLTASQERCAQPFNYQDNTAPQGVVYYRLKVIDVDGKESLSAIVKISSEVKAMELVGIAPNPVSNVAQLKINASKADVVNLTIISTEGQLFYRNNVQLQPGTSVLNLEIAKLPAGVYMIKGMFSDGETNTVKFLKQ